MFESLGRFINRRSKSVLAFFVVGIIVAGFFGFQAFSRFDSGGYTDPNSDSSQAQEILLEEFDVKQPSLVFAHFTVFIHPLRY